jgi:hypothetical protein
VGCQHRRSDSHEKQAMWLNEGGIVAAAFIVNN